MILFLTSTSKDSKNSNSLGTARRRTGFPSWSWAGWQASPLWSHQPHFTPTSPQDLNYWLDHGTWIVWYKPIGTQPPEAIIKEEDVKARLRPEEDVCYSRISQPDLSDRFGELDTTRKTPAATSSLSPAYSDQELLRFYTVALTLTVSLRIPGWTPWPKDNKSGTNALGVSDMEPNACLYDSERRFCGLLRFDIEDLLNEDSECEVILVFDSQ
jgi:hypothetical protein